MRTKDNLARDMDLYEKTDTESKSEENDLAARWIPVALKEIMRNAEEEAFTKV